MAMFDVYVEGATDASPDGARRLAEVMSQRYGLPAAELAARLARGRFRVKANVDRETAQAYVRDLEAVGARIKIEETGGGATPSPRATPSQPHSILPRAPSQPAPASPLPPRTVTPSAVPQSILPRAPSQPVPSSPLPPRADSPAPAPEYASGLSAAFQDTPVPQLGALADDSALSLSSLDGRDDARVIEASPGLPASIGPAATSPAAAAPEARPKDVPLDLFAPPDAQQEVQFELAQDELDHMEARKRAATPPAPVPAVPAATLDKPSSPVLRPKAPTPPGVPIGVAVGGVVSASAREDDTPRWRFAAGVFTAVLLGFIPAHCVASARESAYTDIDQHVTAVELQAGQPDAPIPADRIDAFRDNELGLKHSKRRNIALVSLLIWGVVGAGVGYVWFRRIPWDRIKLGR